MKTIVILAALLALVGAAYGMEWNYNEGMSLSDSTMVTENHNLGDMWKLSDSDHTVKVGGEPQLVVDKFELKPSFKVNDGDGAVAVAAAEQGSLTASVKDINVVVAKDPAGNDLTVARREGYATMDSSLDTVWSAAGDATNDITSVSPDFSADTKLKFVGDNPVAGLGANIVAEEKNTVKGTSKITDDQGDLKGGLFQAASTGWVDATTEAGTIKSVMGGSGISAKIYSWGEFNLNNEVDPTLTNKIDDMKQTLSINTWGLE